MTTQDRLNRLKNRQTLYEVVARNGNRTVLIVYGAKSKSLFFQALAERDQQRAHKLIDLVDSDRIDLTPGKGKPLVIGTVNGWTIEFTGRTQRDAIIEGEYPYLLDV